MHLAVGFGCIAAALVLVFSYVGLLKLAGVLPRKPTIIRGALIEDDPVTGVKKYGKPIIIQPEPFRFSSDTHDFMWFMVAATPVIITILLGVGVGNVVMDIMSK